MVQVLGQPVQVPVQPVGVALIRPWREAGGAGRQGMGGAGAGVVMLEEGNVVRWAWLLSQLLYPLAE